MSLAADRAYERVRAGILNGEFAPASRLKEEELVRLCGVSRTPVREALSRLAAEDYVIVARNQGAHVKTWSDADMTDLFDLRALLEGHAAARAAQLIDSDGLRVLQDNIEEMEAVFRSRGERCAEDRGLPAPERPVARIHLEGRRQRAPEEPARAPRRTGADRAHGASVHDGQDRAVASASPRPCRSTGERRSALGGSGHARSYPGCPGIRTPT